VKARTLGSFSQTSRISSPARSFARAIACVQYDELIPKRIAFSDGTVYVHFVKQLALTTSWWRR